MNIIIHWEWFLIRLGSTNRKADIDIIEELRRRRMNIGFDKISTQETSDILQRTQKVASETLNLMEGVFLERVGTGK